MGIHDLPSQLKQDWKYVTQVDPQQLEDKRLGVDAFVWLHRVVSKASVVLLLLLLALPRLSGQGICLCKWS